MQTRQAPRHSVSTTGTVRSARGMEWQVSVDDLSPGGCRIDDPGGGLLLGELVKLSIAEIGPIVAEVAWRQSSRVGVEFVRPLSERVTTALARDDRETAAAAFAATRHTTAARRFV